MRLAPALLLCLVFAAPGLSPAMARYNKQVNDTEVGDTKPSPWDEDIENKVGVAQKINSKVPLDLTLTDENGKPIKLGSFFEGDRPVVFNLGYSRCPSVCILMRDQLTTAMVDEGFGGLTMGEDFVVLNVSIDPEETPEQARAMRKLVWSELKDGGIEPSAEGWRFLTADQNTIKTLADALGYRYIYIKPQNEYGHPAVLVLADGKGVIKRYLPGDKYTAKTLRLSIVETSQGKAGNIWDSIFLTCFRWDPDANNYAATAKFIMMIGGGVIMLLIAGLVFAGFMYEKRRRQLLEQQANNNPNTDPPKGAMPDTA